MLEKLSVKGDRGKIRIGIQNLKIHLITPEFICDPDYKDDTMKGITDLQVKRPMIMAMFSKNKISHSKVRLIYFSQIPKNDKINPYTNKMHKNYKPLLLVRVFSIELRFSIDEITKERKNLLRIAGLLINTKDIHEYPCDKFVLLGTDNNDDDAMNHNANSSMQDLIEIAEKTINGRGAYNRYLNNCRHFSIDFMKNVEKKYQRKSVKSLSFIFNEHSSDRETPGKDDEKEFQSGKKSTWGSNGSIRYTPSGSTRSPRLIINSGFYNRGGKIIQNYISEYFGDTYHFNSSLLKRQLKI